MKFLMFISCLYIFCFCQISLANESDIVIKRGSVKEKMLFDPLKEDIKILFDNPKLIENIKDDRAIDYSTIRGILISKLWTFTSSFPQPVADVLVKVLDNHSNNKVRQLAAYLMGSWYWDEVSSADNSYSSVVTSLMNAMEDPYWLVRMEAARALGDMKLGYSQLMYWLENERDHRVRVTILDSLYKVITRINKQSSDQFYFLSAHSFVYKLIQLAENDRDIAVRETAIVQLMYVATNARDNWRLVDEEVALDCLTKIANNRKEEPSVRDTAISQIAFIVKNEFINKVHFIVDNKWKR